MIQTATATQTNPEVWVDQHGDYLFRFALIRLRDRSIAEDMVQETMVAALRSVDSFKGESSERTWLVSILKHKIYDHFRKTTKERPIENLEPLKYEDENLFRSEGEWVGHWTEQGAPVEWNITPASVLENKKFWDVLSGCLATLPARTAQVFVLREIDEHSTEEICQTMNISSSNLWVMLHRARMQLRRCLEVKYFGNKPQKDMA